MVRSRRLTAAFENLFLFLGAASSDVFLLNEVDTSNDAVLAQMLQTEMDKEYNQYLTSKEHHVNKNSKVFLN